MTIGQGEYKSQIGLDKLHYAPVTADDAAGYTAGVPVYLAPVATAKVSTTRNTNTQYADDGVFDSSSAESESSVEIEVTNVPLATAALLTGKTYNTTNGMLIEGSGSVAPEYALLFRSKKSNGKYRYVCYLKGKFTLADEEFGTLEANPAPKLAKLTFTGLNTIFAFTTATGKTETVKVVKADEDVAASATLIAGWFTAVPVPVAPA
ncbi:MAG: phage tail protein [Anaerolineaceae bacterium]|jgi:phi13 family phage major tail protein|nr:phage tail protein [Anaerolineaceae bacterium]